MNDNIDIKKNIEWFWLMAIPNDKDISFIIPNEVVKNIFSKLYDEDINYLEKLLKKLK